MLESGLGVRHWGIGHLALGTWHWGIRHSALGHSALCVMAFGIRIDEKK